MSDFDLTEEQRIIVACDAPSIIVNAFAGAAKTTTLIEYAKARPRSRMLYLAFNKAIQESAAGKFPRNVECRTTHSLAYRALGHCYKAKLGNLRVTDVMRYLNVPATVARDVLALTEVFIGSDDDLPAESHIDLAWDIPPEEWDDYVQMAQRLWAAMCAPTDPVVNMTHDGYLKLWTQTKPDLSRQFDIIAVDEAQDSNLCVADLVMSQPCQRILIGDHHQAIYGFRGAIDIMEEIRAEETLALTHSFRFGPLVADYANALLSRFKKENKRVHGCGPEQEMAAQIDETFQYTLIARTNGELFQQAIDCLDKRAYGFVGGISNYPFQKFVDVYHLFVRKKAAIVDPYWRSFPSFADLEEFAEQVNDQEAKSVIAVVKRYTHDLPELVQRVKAEALEDVRETHALFSTTHKCKGLEFAQVKLADDFAELLDPELEITKDHSALDSEEVNIYYVALTRAMAAVEVNPRFADWLAYEKYAAEVHSAQKDGRKPPPLPARATKRETAAARPPHLATQAEWIKQNLDTAVRHGWQGDRKHRLRYIVATLQNIPGCPSDLAADLVREQLAAAGHIPVEDHHEWIIAALGADALLLAASPDTFNVHIAAELARQPGAPQDLSAQSVKDTIDYVRSHVRTHGITWLYDALKRKPGELLTPERASPALAVRIYLAAINMRERDARTLAKALDLPNADIAERILIDLEKSGLLPK